MAFEAFLKHEQEQKQNLKFLNNEPPPKKIWFFGSRKKNLVMRVFQF